MSSKNIQSGNNLEAESADVIMLDHGHQLWDAIGAELMAPSHSFRRLEEAGDETDATDAPRPHGDEDVNMESESDVESDDEEFDEEAYLAQDFGVPATGAERMQVSAPDNQQEDAVSSSTESSSGSEDSEAYIARVMANQEDLVECHPDEPPAHPDSSLGTLDSTDQAIFPPVSIDAGLDPPNGLSATSSIPVYPSNISPAGVFAASLSEVDSDSTGDSEYIERICTNIDMGAATAAVGHGVVRPASPPVQHTAAKFPKLEPGEHNWSIYPQKDQARRRRLQEAVRRGGPGDRCEDAIMIDGSPSPIKNIAPRGPPSRPVTDPRPFLQHGLPEQHGPAEHSTSDPLGFQERKLLPSDLMRYSYYPSTQLTSVRNNFPPHIHSLWTHVGIPDPHPRAFRPSLPQSIPDEADGGRHMSIDPPLNSFELLECHHRVNDKLSDMSYTAAASSLLAAAHAKIETDAVAFASLSATREKLASIVARMDKALADSQRDNENCSPPA